MRYRFQFCFFLQRKGQTLIQEHTCFVRQLPVFYFLLYNQPELFRLLNLLLRHFPLNLVWLFSANSTEQYSAEASRTASGMIPSALSDIFSQADNTFTPYSLSLCCILHCHNDSLKTYQACTRVCNQYQQFQRH